MHLLGIIISLIIFFCSCMGYWELFRRKTKINIYFLPVLTVAVQASVLFIAGLLNILKEISFLLALAGIVALVYFVISDRGISWVKQYRTTGYIYFGVMLVVILLLVNGKVVSHYDNFSHWALVVKRMLLTDRFPNFQDQVIIYQEYPLGSSSFIYYVAKIVGHTESVWMFAQSYMIIACLLPVFIYCRKNRVLSFLFMLLSTNFILIYIVQITDLLVDTLLPLAAMSMLIYIYYYARRGNRFGIEFYLFIPFGIWVLQIKNAGVYFCVIASIWILLGIRKRKRKFCRVRLIKSVLVAFSPYISLFLWKKHCSYVFVGAEESKHAMTVENYITGLKEKSLEDIWKICSSWIKFCLTYKEVWLIFFCLVVAGVIYYFVCKKFRRQFYLATLFAVFLFIAYQIGTMGMYVFSMPLSEALRLASSERYTRSILLAVFYVILILYMKIFSELNRVNIKNVMSNILLLATIIAVWGLTDDGFELFFNISGDNRSTERKWIESNVDKYTIPQGAKCYIVANDNQLYLMHICRYILQSSQVTPISVDSQEDLEQITDWDYVFIYDNENPIIQDWIQEYYPDQLNQNVIVKGE